jgi:anti-anti-sigma factor
MVIVEFAGEFDIAQAERLHDALGVAARAEQALLDMTNVTYMDSAMLNALVAFRRERSENGFHDRIAIEGANAMARRLFALTHLNKLFDLRDEPVERPKLATHILVLGRDLPKSRSAEEFAYALDRMLSADPAIATRREADGAMRWIRGTRQCQVHCVSDTDVVLLQLHQEPNEAFAHWSVDDVKKMTIDQISPWTAAEGVIDYLSAVRTAALG